MELDEDHNEQVLCTLVSKNDQNYGKCSPAVSNNNTKQMTNTHAQTNNTTRTFRSLGTRYNLRANHTPEKYTDLLSHQIGENWAALRLVGT